MAEEILRPCPACMKSTIPEPNHEKQFDDRKIVHQKDGTVILPCPHCGATLRMDATRQVVMLVEPTNVPG